MQKVSAPVKEKAVFGIITASHGSAFGEQFTVQNVFMHIQHRCTHMHVSHKCVCKCLCY